MSIESDIIKIIQANGLNFNSGVLVIRPDGSCEIVGEILFGGNSTMNRDGDLSISGGIHGLNSNGSALLCNSPDGILGFFGNVKSSQQSATTLEEVIAALKAYGLLTS